MKKRRFAPPWMFSFGNLAMLFISPSKIYFESKSQPGQTQIFFGTPAGYIVWIQLYN